MPVEHVHAVMMCRRCGGHDTAAFDTLAEFVEWMKGMHQTLLTDETRKPKITAFSTYYMSFQYTSDGIVHPYYITYRYCEEHPIAICVDQIVAERKSVGGIVMMADLQTGKIEVVPVRNAKDLEGLPEELREALLADHPELKKMFEKTPTTLPSEALPVESLPDTQKVDDAAFRRLIEGL